MSKVEVEEGTGAGTYSLAKKWKKVLFIELFLSAKKMERHREGEERRYSFASENYLRLKELDLKIDIFKA